MTVLETKTASIEHRALKNTVLGVFSFLVSLCQTIILVPVLLHNWGNTTYGIWLAVMAGFSMLQSLDFGHQCFIGSRLNMQYHQNRDAFRHTLGSSLRIAYFLGLLELIFCLALIAGNMLPHFLSIPGTAIDKYHVSAGLVLLMTMWLTFGSAGGVVVRIMIPTGLLYESQWMGIVLRLGQFIAITCVAIQKSDILNACLWYAIVQALISLAILWYLRIRLSEYFPWWRNASWQEGFANLWKSLILTAISFTQQLANNGLVIFISALFSATLIPSFSTIRTVTNTATAVTTIFTTALIPDMVRFHVVREPEKLLETLNANWFISGICVNFGIVLVLPVIEPVYQVWTKGILEFNAPLFLLLAVAVSVTNFGAGITTYLVGINDLRAQTAMTLARCAALFLFGYAFSSAYGIISIGIGSIFAEVLSSVILPLVYVRTTLAAFSARLSPRHIIIALLPPSSLLIAGCVIILYRISPTKATVALLPVMIAIYCANWYILGREVRGRISLLGTAILKKLSLDI